VNFVTAHAQMIFEWKPRNNGESFKAFVNGIYCGMLTTTSDNDKWMLSIAAVIHPRMHAAERRYYNTSNEAKTAFESAAPMLIVTARLKGLI